MMRWIVVPALAALLGGCVSYPEYRSYDDGYYARDSYQEPVYAGGSSYYSPGTNSGGDYYYQDYGYSSAYLDYPYYYSLFYPLNRWSVDPYWYPSFYYGVTYYPRSYFSVGYGSSYGYGGRYGGYGYLSYSFSPYRNSWVDNYYDWHSYYDHSPSRNNSYYAPRYGNARNEAAWLSSRSRFNNNSGYRDSVGNYRDGGLPRTQTYRQEDRSREAVINRREAVRGADYGRSSTRRADPGVSGFGYDGDPSVKRPNQQREPVGTLRGERGGRSNYGTERSDVNRYRGDSGDIRSQSPRRAAERTYTPADRARQADAQGYRLEPSRAPAYRQPTQRASEPREASTYRQDGPRQEDQRQYRSPREATSYEAPVRESRAQSVAPREAYTPRAERYRESAPQRSFEAPQRNYEQAPQRSYEQAPQRSYEPPQRNYEQAPQRSYEAPQRSYEAPQRNYERAEQAESRSEARAERSEQRGEDRPSREREDEPG